MRKLGIRGSINVFVALIMVPTVAFTGVMVDFARLNMASVQVTNAAYLAANSALAHYNGLLFEVYGLLATSHDRAEMERFAEIVALTTLGFDEDGNRMHNNFNLFGPGNVNLTMGPENELYTLDNLAFLRYQILQYMAFRILLTALPESAAASGIDRPDLTPERANNILRFMEDIYDDVIEEIGKLWEIYFELEEAYLEVEQHVHALNQRIEDYVNRMQTLQGFIDLEMQMDPPNLSQISAWQDEINRLKNLLRTALRHYEDLIEKARDLSVAADAQAEVVRQRIGEAIQHLENGIATERYCRMTANAIIVDLQEMRDGGDGISPAILRNHPLAGHGNNFVTDNLFQYSNIRINGLVNIPSVAPRINLQNYGRGNSVLRDEIRVMNTEVELDDNQRNMLRELDLDGNPQLPRLSEDDNEASSDEVPGRPNLRNLSVPSEYHQRAERRRNVGIGETGIIETVADFPINRLLTVEYAVQMFSNYTTNRRYLADGSRLTNETTLSGIPIDNSMNYLFGAELEYILIGNPNAQASFNRTIAILTVQLAAANLAFTFMCRDIRQSIWMVRKAAGTIVGIFTFGLGAKAAAIAAGEAYRVAIVALETAVDIDTLLSGMRVPIIKTPGRNEWRSGLHTIGQDNPWNTRGTHFTGSPMNANRDLQRGPGLYYYEKVRNLILIRSIFELDEITSRIATLIELNMNYHLALQNGATSPPSSPTHFDLRRAYVLSEATLEVDFRHYFINWNYVGGRAGSQFRTTAIRRY